MEKLRCGVVVEKANPTECPKEAASASLKLNIKSDAIFKPLNC